MLRLIKLIIWIIVISGGILWWNYNSFTKSEMCIDFVDGSFTVESGETFTTALTKIYPEKILTKIYLKLNPPEFKLQAGKYEIQCGNITSFIEQLQKPINETDENITFLEGWNIYDIDKTLRQKGFIKEGEFIDFVSNCERFCFLKKEYSFIADTETLEGFLYPDTYAVNPQSFTVETLVRKMLNNFQKKVIDSGIVSDIGSIEILDILNMASIVQKEANKADNPQEIAIIAGILKKRLEEGWQIGADATVCYAYQVATQDCTPAKVLQYLYEKNEYNTRQKTGLPRTAIANPEAEVIQATIKSKDSPYYYYLHDNSGQIHYGITGNDHEANKAKYL